MTLIQTLMSDDLVIQVSDRRLTHGRTATVVDDRYTKLVCWNFNFSIGFTGLAHINPAQKRSTSEWIAETICDVPAADQTSPLLVDADQTLLQAYNGLLSVDQAFVAACETGNETPRPCGYRAGEWRPAGCLFSLEIRQSLDQTDHYDSDGTVGSPCDRKLPTQASRSVSINAVGGRSQVAAVSTAFLAPGWWHLPTRTQSRFRGVRRRVPAVRCSRGFDAICPRRPAARRRA
jgi:hypothetical protein